VATLDNDAEEIFRGSADFIRAVVAGRAAARIEEGTARD